jgi:hypothetical protein
MSPSALRHQIGQLLIAGFRGEQIPVEIRSLSREFGLGGVIRRPELSCEPRRGRRAVHEAS